MSHAISRLTLAALTALTALGCTLPVHSQTAAASPPAAKAADDEASFTVTGFKVDGDNPLPAALTQATLQPFVGQHNGIERLQQAASALEEVLRDRGFGFYRVVLPPQDIGGEIKLQMFKFLLGTTEVKGNQVFTNENILRSVAQLKQGTSPNTHDLARDLAVANENPSKRANVTFKQGQVADTIDATIDVADSRTVTGFVAIANTGTLATGYNRVTAGVTHNNLFDLDHQGTFTYTTSPSAIGQVRQYGGYYKAPMYQWGGILSGYYSWSSVDSGSVAGLNVTGRGQFLGVQYAHYFAPEGDYRAYLSVGLDDKHFDNSKIVTAGGLPVFPDYRTRPVTVSYVGRFDKKWGFWGYNIDWVRNLTWGGGNNDFAAGANRAGATNRWFTVRLGADITMALPEKWVGTARLKTQLSGKALVPGEQFGFGGAQSLRGLTERQISGDTGWLLNLEALSPPIMENLRGIVFYDVGQVRRHDDLITPQAGASSVGFGLRWAHGNNLSGSVDYARVLSMVNGFPPGTARDRVHFSMNWKF